MESRPPSRRRTAFELSNVTVVQRLTGWVANFGTSGLPFSLAAAPGRSPGGGSPTNGAGTGPGTGAAVDLRRWVRCAGPAGTRGERRPPAGSQSQGGRARSLPAALSRCRETPGPVEWINAAPALSRRRSHQRCASGGRPEGMQTGRSCGSGVASVGMVRAEGVRARQPVRDGPRRVSGSQPRLQAKSARRPWPSRSKGAVARRSERLETPLGELRIEL